MTVELVDFLLFLSDQLLSLSVKAGEIDRRLLSLRLLAHFIVKQISSLMDKPFIFPLVVVTELRLSLKLIQKVLDFLFVIIVG